MTDKFTPLPESLRHLVRIAAAIAGAGEETTRKVMEEAVGHADHTAVDEVIIQSYLFAGFPRTLNAARAWRVASGTPAPTADASALMSDGALWEQRGEQTCEIVYGDSYNLLRENVRKLHPALDAWMITDGYGKVLSRPQLDLATRELCIVAACAASGQQRQLHSHLHGALNAGVPQDRLASAIESLDGLVSADELKMCRSLLSHVVSRRHPPKTAVAASQ